MATMSKRIYNLLRRIKRKLFRPKVMRHLKIQGISEPRLRGDLDNMENVKPVVHRITVSEGLEQSRAQLKDLLNNKYRDLISGKNVLIKYNLNTANPYPASVSPQMLSLLAELLAELGAKKITAGDCCTISLLPTKTQVNKAGLTEALAGRAQIICFDDQPWVTVIVGGQYLKQVTIPRAVQEADTIIALANLKTHRQALYTGALKLAVGFMHPLERRELHRKNLQEKIAELNLAVQPDLYLLDARRAMISGGPDYGDKAAGNTVLVGSNPLAVDIEAYKLLYKLQLDHGSDNILSEDPFSLLQFKHARDIGLGGLPWQGYSAIDIKD
jgi:uncharacterized protein (DUF362 family)